MTLTLTLTLKMTFTQIIEMTITATVYQQSFSGFYNLDKYPTTKTVWLLQMGSIAPSLNNNKLTF